MNKLSKISLSIIGTLLIAGTSSLAATGTVNTNGVRIRKDATTDSEIVTNLNNGTDVEVLEQKDNWYKVKYNDSEGYMHKDYITIKDGETIKNEDYTNNQEPENVTTDDNIENTSLENNQEQISEFPKNAETSRETKVYIIPSITGKIKTILSEKTQITINKEINNWQYVTAGDFNGWIRKTADIIDRASDKKEPESNESEPEENVEKGYISESSVNFRKEPNTNSEVLSTLKYNTEITIIGEDGDWYKVRYQENEGYVSKKLVSENPQTTSRSSEPRKSTQENQLKIGYINVGVANVREKANTSSKIVDTLKRNCQVEIMGEEKAFYEINLNGKTGYISKNLVSDKIEEISMENTQTQSDIVVSNNGTTSGEAIVDFAKKYLGYNYVYGGTTPANGFDCSGFIYYVFNSCGYKISRSCSQQANSGKAVEKSDLQLGDIIFFNNTSDGSIGHVGIYIGNGKFIHAANARRGVVTDTINSGYYYTYYYKARRIAD